MWSDSRVIDMKQDQPKKKDKLSTKSENILVGCKRTALLPICMIKNIIKNV